MQKSEQLKHINKIKILENRKCEYCGKLFRPKNSNIRFCSLACNYKKRPLRGGYKECLVCGESFYVKSSRLHKAKYCSYNCKNKSQMNRVELFCLVCGKKYTRPKSQVRWRGSSICSRECVGEFIRITKSGENAPQWKGGVSRTYKEGFHNTRYKSWREAVFERDNYTCQKCGARNGNGEKVFLEPHHIFRWAYFPEFRYVISNGVTLCKDCHIKYRKYDKKMQLVKIN